MKCKSIDDPLYNKGKRIETDIYELEGHIRHFFSKEYLSKKLCKFEIVKISKTSSTYHSYKSKFVEAIAKKT